MRLSDEEVDLLKSAIAGYYGNSAGGNFDKNIFTNFMSKSKPSLVICNEIMYRLCDQIICSGRYSNS